MFTSKIQQIAQGITLGRKEIIAIFLVLAFFGIRYLDSQYGPGIRIVVPVDGATVVLDQPVQIVAEPVGGADIVKVAFLPVGSVEGPPFEITWVPPVGRQHILAIGVTRDGDRFGDQITINVVQQDASRLSISDFLFLAALILVVGGILHFFKSRQRKTESKTTEVQP